VCVWKSLNFILLFEKYKLFWNMMLVTFYVAQKPAKFILCSWSNVTCLTMLQCVDWCRENMLKLECIELASHCCILHKKNNVIYNSDWWCERLCIHLKCPWTLCENLLVLLNMEAETMWTSIHSISTSCVSCCSYFIWYSVQPRLLHCQISFGGFSRLGTTEENPGWGRTVQRRSFSCFLILKIVGSWF